MFSTSHRKRREEISAQLEMKKKKQTCFFFQDMKMSAIPQMLKWQNFFENAIFIDDSNWFIILNIVCNNPVGHAPRERGGATIQGVKQM